MCPYFGRTIFQIALLKGAVGLIQWNDNCSRYFFRHANFEHLQQHLTSHTTYSLFRPIPRPTMVIDCRHRHRPPCRADFGPGFRRRPGTLFKTGPFLKTQSLKKVVSVFNKPAWSLKNTSARFLMENECFFILLFYFVFRFPLL